MSSFGNQSQAQRILDRYFAYAVALGVEKVVIEQANEIGGMLPSWSYTSDWEPDRGSVSSRNNFPNSQPSEPTAPNSPQSASGGLPPLNFPAKDGDAKSTTATPRPRPSLSGMSQQLTNTLSGASDNLASLLTMAVSNTDQGTPFATLWQGTQTVGKVSADVASTTLEILGEILENSSSGDGGGGYSSSGSSRSSWSSSRSRSSSSSNSGRSSSSRRSGGGGKRGFG